MRWEFPFIILHSAHKSRSLQTLFGVFIAAALSPPLNKAKSLSMKSINTLCLFELKYWLAVIEASFLGREERLSVRSFPNATVPITFSSKADSLKWNSIERIKQHQKLLSESKTEANSTLAFIERLPWVGAGDTVIRATATTLQRVAAIDDALSGDWKVPKSIIFLFDTCVWHGGDPAKRIIYD